MKHFLLIALTFLFIATACKSTEIRFDAPSGSESITQVTEDKPERSESNSSIDQSEHNKVFVHVDEPPKPSNGMSDLQQRIARTVSSNSSAGCDKLSGERIIYRFVVDKQGNISKMETLYEKPNLCTELVEITIRTIKLTPAKYNGRSVSVQFSLPVTF